MILITISYCVGGPTLRINIQILSLLHVAPCLIAIAGIVVELHCLVKDDLLDLIRIDFARV